MNHQVTLMWGHWSVLAPRKEASTSPRDMILCDKIFNLLPVGSTCEDRHCETLLCNTWPCLQIILYSCADLGTDYSLCLLLSTGADSIFHPVMSTDNVAPPIVPSRRLSPGVNRGWGCCWTPYNAQDGQPVTQNGLRCFQRCSEKPCPMPLLFKVWFLFCLTWELASQFYQVKLCIGEAWFKMVLACWMIHRD